jgi:hypothetical protein
MHACVVYGFSLISGTVRRAAASPVVGRRLLPPLPLTRNARQTDGIGVRARDAAFPVTKLLQRLRLHNALLTANGMTPIILAIKF